MILEVPTPTVIAEGTRLLGTLTFYSNTQIYGVVDGKVYQQSLEPLHIGKGGWISGEIHSEGPILIEGRMDGKIQSKTKIRLFSSSIVSGILDAPSIEISAGALFEGELKMEPHPIQKKSKSVSP